MEQYSISAAPWFPLSAVYPYDDNINLMPTFTLWKDGYTFYYHPLFEHAKDVVLNKQTAFYLTSAVSLFNFLHEATRGDANLGAYVSFLLSGMYITVNPVNNILYLSGTFLREENFFRAVPNDDGSYYLMQGAGKYITVQETMPFNLYATENHAEAIQDQQKFFFYDINNQVYITTKFNTPVPMYEPPYIERFVSYGNITFIVRAVGMVSDDDYEYENEYLFDITGFSPLLNITGLTRDQTWVRYYNQLFDRKNNTNVEVQESKCISGVHLNRLVDLPYLTKVLTNNTMQINIANLKNIETPEYEYDVRTTVLCAFES